MPRRITKKDTFDTIENEILFTRAALKADDDAALLLGETAEWLGRLDAARAQDRAFRERDMDATAGRAIANVRLDMACMNFGADLLHATKSRTVARFLGFFPVAPGRFIKQAFGKQVLAVKGWLTVAGDDVLEAHRPTISVRVGKAEAAQVAAAGLGPARAANWHAREELADDLTRLRDGLHRALAERAEELGLARSWPDAFFRVEGDDAAAETTGTPGTTGTTGTTGTPGTTGTTGTSETGPG